MKRSTPEEIKAIRAHLRSLLPRAAFEATPAKAIPLVLHVAVVVGSAFAIARLPHAWQWAICALIAGHSMAAASFYGHDLSHGHLVRQRHVRRLLEYVVWTVTLQPTTVWRETHNRVHHRNTNTLRDAFRYYAETERTFAHSLYSWMMIPNRVNRGNPMILLAPTFLHMMHATAAVFAPNAERRALISGFGDYRRADRVKIALEMALIGAFQVAIFYACGQSWARYLWAGPATMGVASLIGGVYTYSQHSLHDLGEHDNPFATTTLKLPAIVNRLHMNLAHHTAHHLFDSVNPDYLPRVTELLREHYPSKLDERGPVDCWRAIYRNAVYKRAPGAWASPAPLGAAPETTGARAESAS